MRKKKIGAFDIINYSLMILLMASFVIPFWIIIAASVSDNGALQAEGISLQIKGFTFEAYKFLFTMNDIFIRSIGVSFLTSLLTALLYTGGIRVIEKISGRKKILYRDFYDYHVFQRRHDTYIFAYPRNRHIRYDMGVGVAGRGVDLQHFIDTQLFLRIARRDGRGCEDRRGERRRRAYQNFRAVIGAYDVCDRNHDVYRQVERMVAVFVVSRSDA